MRFLTLLSLVVFLAACQNNTTAEATTTEANPLGLSIMTEDTPHWEKDQLRLYPIVADANFLAENAEAAQYQVLRDALENQRFRISEKKPYGRFEDSGAVNALTVQNRTEAPVLLLGGEIVQGGNQDRVVGEDMIIAARSIQDIEVFCVEKGRWTYKEENRALNEGDRKVFAFRGYYNMASTRVRSAAARNDQSGVWEQVGDIRSKHNIEGNTSAYADLESNNDFVNERTDYMRYFGDKLEGNESIVGFVAVSGNKVLGADVFGSPALLNQQFEALLSGYATDAITSGNGISLSESSLAHFNNQLLSELIAGEGLHGEDHFVHYAKLAE